jgi:hypothetical protein
MNCTPMPPEERRFQRADVGHVVVCVIFGEGRTWAADFVLREWGGERLFRDWRAASRDDKLVLTAQLLEALTTPAEQRLRTIPTVEERTEGDDRPDDSEHVSVLLFSDDDEPWTLDFSVAAEWGVDRWRRSSRRQKLGLIARRLQNPPLPKRDDVEPMEDSIEMAAFATLPPPDDPWWTAERIAAHALLTTKGNRGQDVNELIEQTMEAMVTLEILEPVTDPGVKPGTKRLTPKAIAAIEDAKRREELG